MKQVPLLALAALGATLTINSHASVLFSDTFSYSPGDLTAVSGGLWAAHSGTNAMPVQVAGGSIGILQGSGSREDVHRLTGLTLSAGDVLYAGFDLTVTGDATVPVYFAHFLRTSTTFDTRLWLLPEGAAGGEYSLGINNGSSSPSSGWATPLSGDTTYRIVLSYEYDTGNGQLWVNPTTVGDTSISTTGFAGDNVVGFGFRQASGDSSQFIDNLVVATSFNEALTVPEPTSLALGALGGAMLVLKRRKKA